MAYIFAYDTMNTVKRVEVRNMEYFKVKTTYNVLNKSFDTEAEAKEYARRLSDFGIKVAHKLLIKETKQVR